MRSQRRAPVTVRIVKVSASDSDLGDDEVIRDTTLVEGAIFAPERPLERVGTDADLVLRPAAWHLPGLHALDADDLVEELVDPTDPESAAGAVWQVIGGSVRLIERTEVPVRRTSAT